ncbi:MAG: hypothetical protein Q9183_006856 [Haloplaca sp. 2 TL-2023]
MDLVKSLFADKVLALRTEIAAVDDGVNKLIWIGAQVPATLDATYTLEAKSVPDTTRSDIALMCMISCALTTASTISKISTYQLGSPLQVA